MAAYGIALKLRAQRPWAQGGGGADKKLAASNAILPTCERPAASALVRRPVIGVGTASRSQIAHSQAQIQPEQAINRIHFTSVGTPGGWLGEW